MTEGPPRAVGRGGTPPPAHGRAKGTPNKRTLARLGLIEQGLADGASPLDVMLNNMRFAHDKAQLLTKQLERLTPEEGETKAAAGERRKRGAALLKEMMSMRVLSQDCASQAAPFVHPRLTTIAVKPPEPEGGARIIVEGGLPRRASDARKPTEDEVRGILEGTAVDVTPRGPEEQ